MGVPCGGFYGERQTYSQVTYPCEAYKTTDCLFFTNFEQWQFINHSYSTPDKIWPSPDPLQVRCDDTYSMWMLVHSEKPVKKVSFETSCNPLTEADVKQSDPLTSLANCTKDNVCNQDAEIRKGPVYPMFFRVSFSGPPGEPAAPSTSPGP